ncbi:dTDP-glucose 4,6-dehydratase [Nocardiopsis sp. MG754419]|uniref:dTDP-glucose 4,6-dehydratase n=1 Tax=Nocardiopsis sp. MG754419 TaxID=2259865 RepID=UPI001BAD879E|nr:dTDP-glucose 4,6-dehydratase [Nocardiopsis sp. MG754419]MBR8745256.1 dTDP-glucose 4,6-dehydratase [Nocardiopsis sp. MG754419]
MSVLVTGGAGFIGSNFVRRSLEDAYPVTRGAAVTVLDRLTYAGNLDNLAPVRDDPRLRFVRGDVRDASLVRDLMAEATTVVHFAAETHVDRSIDGASEFVSTNVVGTQVLLDAALEAGVERFLLVSTDEVYGSADEGAWTEDSPLLPNSPYSASKAAADHMARAYFRTHGLPVVTVRTSNNYGPYQHPEKLIPLFTTRLLEQRTVPLYGDGGNVREWVHVDDHCRGIALALEHGAPGGVYNIGSEDRVGNIDIATALVRLTGADLSLVRRVADRKGHDRRYALDSTRARTELGHRPRVPLDQGLAETVEWYRRHRAWWSPSASAVPTPRPVAQKGTSHA